MAAAAKQLLDVPEALTIDEVAAAIRASRSTVYRHIASGELETCDIAPRGSLQPKTRVPVESLRKFLAGRTRTAPKLRSVL